MSDNTCFCILLSILIGGCAVSAVSKNIFDVEKLKIESGERLEIFKATGKVVERPQQ